jgi:hypothetical protein
MIRQPLILLHEESLRMTHPVFDKVPHGTTVIYIWDDAYFQRAAYSLKRLIFIYETLCTMELDILRGETIDLLQEINPSCIFIPITNNPLLLDLIHSIRKQFSVEIVADDIFVTLKKPLDSKRFFQYWNKIEKKAFINNGGVNA